MKLWQLIKSHLGPYRNVLLIVVVLQAIATFASLTLPTINALLIDNGVLQGDNDYILTMGGVMMGFTVVQIIFTVGAVWYASRAAMGFGRDIRRDLFHTVTGYSAREVGQFGAPSLITRTTNDVQQIQMLVVMACTMMITAPITMVIGIVFAVREDPGLSMILVFAIPAAVIALGSIVYRMVPSFQAMQFRIDRVNLVLREQITGMRVVRAFVREPQEVERFSQANDELTQTSLRAGRLMAATFPTVMLIINLSSVAVIWIGGDRIGAGQMEIGSLVAYLSYLMQILFAVVMMTFMVSMIPRAGVAADRVAEVLDTPSTVRQPEHPVTEVFERGTLEFRDVAFAYPGADRPVLSNISFRVEAGTTTAIIGSTGAGKTTLMNLVSRLSDATEGVGARRRGGRPRTRPRPVVEQGRLRPAEAVPVLGNGRVEPAVRAPRRRRRRTVGSARSRAGERIRAGDARRCRRARSPRAARTCRVASANACASRERSW